MLFCVLWCVEALKNAVLFCVLGCVEALKNAVLCVGVCGSIEECCFVCWGVWRH